MEDSERSALLGSVRDAVASTDTAPVDPLVEQKVEDHKIDRELRKTYATWYIWILIGQLVLFNILIFLYGFKKITFDEVTLRVFTCATLSEIFGIVLVITKYLFSRK